jgi:hypothetical protein
VVSATYNLFRCNLFGVSRNLGRCDLYVNRDFGAAKAADARARIALVFGGAGRRERRVIRFQRTIELDQKMTSLLGSGRSTASDEPRTSRSKQPVS